MSALAARFSSRRTELRSVAPLTDDEIRTVAPSIFAEEKHESRSDRYAYIPTGDVLQALIKQGFQPFMAAQTRTRDEGKREHTKHMLRLRHADQIATSEANEIILLNSHDGTSSYQMLAGVFRFVCANGMVCGELSNDIRIRHSGNVVDNVIEGAFRVLDDFELVDQHKGAMKGVKLSEGEQAGFARAALALKYGTELAPAPVTESQILRARRSSDTGADLWATLNRIQENVIRGGLNGRSASNKRMTTRPVKGIDQNIKLNRALWVLAEEMRKLKG
jgi:hypothetical protein